MALVNKPDESIFASSAKQGEVDNFPDLLRGWGITFDQTQGIPPMEWFNFLFKRLDEKHTYLMQRGLPEWSATQDYTKGSCVQFDGVSYRALKNSKNNSPNESNSQYWVRWGFALSEIAQATLTQYGITKLYTGYDSQSEDLALTPKTAYQLKQLIDSNTRSLGNVIPNSKKSSAVNSNSAETVATSAAVKTAYDLANSKQSPATTLAGYGIGNFKIENFVGNLNTLKTDGIYAITQVSRSQNLPVSTSCHIQVVAGGDGAWCRQLAYVAYSTDVYERHQTNYQTDSWSPWVRIDVRDEFDALKDIFIGIPIPYPLSTVPTGCLAMNGQRFDTRRYPKLAQKYPSGQLPDMRGEFIRGLDNGRGVDGGRALLSIQKPTIMAIDNNIRDLAVTGIVMLDDSTVQQAAQHASADLLNRNDYPNIGFVLNAFNDTETREKALQDKYTAASGVNRILSTPSSARGWGAFGVRPRNIAYHYICLAE